MTEDEPEHNQGYHRETQEEREIESLQSRLTAAEKERDEALAVLGPGWPETLLETCQSYKTADDAVPEDMHGADTLAQVIEWLTGERDELKQRCAKLKETLIHSNYPRCSSCGASTASDEPHAADCHVTAALAPDSGADCGTKEGV